MPAHTHTHTQCGSGHPWRRWGCFCRLFMPGNHKARPKAHTDTVRESHTHTGTSRHTDRPGRVQVMAFYNSGSALVPPLSLLLLLPLLLLLLMYSIQIASWAAFIFGAGIIHQWHYGQWQAEWTPLSAAGAAAADVFVSPSQPTPFCMNFHKIF